jgi:hypothetical protein
MTHAMILLFGERVKSVSVEMDFPVKGSFSIESQPKRGTTIHARVLSVLEAIPCVPPGKDAAKGELVPCLW